MNGSTTSGDEMGCNLYRERHSSHARALARMHDQGHTHEVHACAQLWAGGRAGRQAGRQTLALFIVGVRDQT